MRIGSRILLLVMLQLATGGTVRASDAFFVDVDRDSTFQAVRVSPSSLGFITLIRADGSKSYVMDKDVQSIHDASGRDWTERVLTARKGVGTAPMVPPAPRPDGQPPGVPRLRGRPSPLDDAFPILQVGVLWRVDEASNWNRESGGSIVSDIGAMQNVGRRIAVGGTMHLAFAEGNSRIGAKARVRWWLGETTSIDFAPGVLFGSKYNGYAQPAFVSEASLTFGDWVALTAQMEVRRRKDLLPAWYYPPYSEGGDTDTTLLLGGKIGGDLGLFMLLPMILIGATYGGIDSAIP